MISSIEKIKPKINKIIELAKSHRESIEEEKAFEEFDSSNLDKVLNAYKSYINSESRKNLIDYFENLTDNEIMLVQTIMYIGRDETEDGLRGESIDSLINSYFKELGFELDKPIKRDVEINQIIQKMPLDEYLIRGLKLIDTLI